MKTIHEKFFEPINTHEVDTNEYQKLEMLTDAFEKLSRINNQSIYIIDYFKECFWYVSPHHLFLCGYTPEEVKEMGYLFYEKVVSAEDLQMLLEINQIGWNLFHESTPDSRKDFCFSYDFYLYHKNKTKILVNHKISPLFLTNNGDIWLAICIINPSPNKDSGNVIFTKNDKTEYYTYDFEKKQIIPHIPMKLTKREEEVFLLNIRGYSTAEIAEELCLSENTVRNHRSSIEKKMGVNNLSNAVALFYSTF